MWETGRKFLGPVLYAGAITASARLWQWKREPYQSPITGIGVSMFQKWTSVKWKLLVNWRHVWKVCKWLWAPNGPTDDVQWDTVRPSICCFNLSPISVAIYGFECNLTAGMRLSDRCNRSQSLVFITLCKSNRRFESKAIINDFLSQSVRYILAV